MVKKMKAKTVLEVFTKKQVSILPFVKCIEELFKDHCNIAELLLNTIAAVDRYLTRFLCMSVKPVLAM